MKLEKYRDFIIINKSIWFDFKDYSNCNSLMYFAKKDQIKPWIDDFHKKYEFIGDRYILRIN